jgi:hypothetical protein
MGGGRELRVVFTLDGRNVSPVGVLLLGRRLVWSVGLVRGGVVVLRHCVVARGRRPVALARIWLVLRSILWRAAGRRAAKPLKC